ncbi:hypothetical protein NFHSH190041_26650 [Shewanella sp. NFH-SH190041]|nr:hypothetical protein NFHSH190041_26650 [Shewanella sp. NFH-SH190041]
MAQLPRLSTVITAHIQVAERAANAHNANPHQIAKANIMLSNVLSAAGSGRIIAASAISADVVR